MPPRQPKLQCGDLLHAVARQVSITGLLAIGMTFVILTAGIDLSVGSLLAFASLVAAAVAKGGLLDRFTVGHAAIGYGWPLALLASVAVGLAGGSSYMQQIIIGITIVLAVAFETLDTFAKSRRRKA